MKKTEMLEVFKKELELYIEQRKMMMKKVEQDVASKISILKIVKETLKENKKNK